MLEEIVLGAVQRECWRDAKADTGTPLRGVLESPKRAEMAEAATWPEPWGWGRRYRALGGTDGVLSLLPSF